MTESDRANNQYDLAESEHDPGSELAVMAKVSEALKSLSDPRARERVIHWAASVFQLQPPPKSEQTKSSEKFLSSDHIDGGREIPGIARVTENGELHLTVRDLKARSANDAAIRIAHIALLANERLNRSESLSSKNVLVPILRKYRAYDGNTRGALAQHRGFARVGDQLSMDLHCKEETEEFMRQILDPTVQGSWNPAAKPTKKKRHPNKDEDPVEAEQSES